MSRIGKMPISIPEKVEVTIADGNRVTVKGPKGELTKSFYQHLIIEKKDNEILVSIPEGVDNKKAMNKLNMFHGTTRALLHDMVEGVLNGYTRVLEIKGVGYRAEMRGKDLVLHVGHSHEDVLHPLPGVEISVKQSEITVTGIDKQEVGQMASIIRATKKPECYHGKGIRYKGEVIALRQPASAKKQAAGK